jgi:hypothetical protein
MARLIWNHSLGYFDGKAFWEAFSASLGSAFGFSMIFWPLIIFLFLQ